MLDKDVTDDVLTAKKADAGSGGFSKKLLPGNQDLSDIRKVIGRARNAHYRLTAPWGRVGEAPSKGARMLTTSAHGDHAKMVEGFKNEFDPLVKKFIKNYDDHKKDAKKKLAGLYKDSDYPPTNELAVLFELEVDYATVSDPSNVDDFRLTMPAERVDELKAEIEDFNASAVINVQHHLYQKLLTDVEHLEKTLSNPDKKGFHSTLTTNVSEIAGIVQKLNVQADPVLNELAEDAKELGEVTTEDIKKDPRLRKTVAKKAKTHVKKIKGKMEGF
jgi:hypothetical protein